MTHPSKDLSRIPIHELRTRLNAALSSLQFIGSRKGRRDAERYIDQLQNELGKRPRIQEAKIT